MGFGAKSDFTSVKSQIETPAPTHYDPHLHESLSYKSKKSMKSTTQQHGFFNKYDKYEKICYKGMEQHFYCRDTKGPGAYLPQSFVHQSLTKKAQEYSVPKNNRGLLTAKDNRLPGPANYQPD
mmetsp:Transcript_2236/g.3391  ORF Transcript_2236/g.3391 Transcript_2236/m.3391 type:complete len:123 (-) Transcript_2236:123-491(-)|eukprot:CAMPEP_0170484642 /NCGR_PEP_ID=MMETSP0208-20121228/4046_1 /TAXON_ID=197538 /ORGANISM="Strombidium inclinatum, Strain S3" /LENGTH=122 /DNA_ID=CAMNT_0010758015 /DNA_START=1019 /DNA_END=1387 /DNA_ORIENTATION=-